jgi:hypothetical protein
MVSLLTEYRNRHGMNFVVGVDEGLCFFDVGKKPSAIVMTSSHSRSISTCRQCLSHQGGLLTELFVHTNTHFPNQCWKLLRHEHLDPDVDLREWVNKHARDRGAAYEPFMASDDRQLEAWLWRFFVRGNPLFNRKWTYKDEPFRSLEQMAWVIDNSGRHHNQPRLFESFYKSLFYTFMLGRKYLLYG